MRLSLQHSRAFNKLLVLLPVFVLLVVFPAQAQRLPGILGVGVQVGDYNGLSLKFYNPRRVSAEFLTAWDFDERVFLDGHAMFERDLDSQGRVHVFYGPGGFVKLHDRPNEQEDDTEAGVSAKLGLGFMINRFEIYAHVTPRLRLTPSVNDGLGGGLGLRFYL